MYTFTDIEVFVSGVNFDKGSGVMNNRRTILHSYLIESVPNNDDA
jgi:hypothetical protein